MTYPQYPALQNDNQITSTDQIETGTLSDGQRAAKRDKQITEIRNLVICPQIVNLFPVQRHPEILADEFHQVKLVFEPRTVTGYPDSETII